MIDHSMSPGHVIAARAARKSAHVMALLARSSTPSAIELFADRDIFREGTHIVRRAQSGGAIFDLLLGLFVFFPDRT